MAGNDMYEFKVTDANGTWGTMRIGSSSPTEAETTVRKTLEQEEVEPNGSLLPEFSLELIAQLPATTAEAD